MGFGHGLTLISYVFECTFDETSVGGMASRKLTISAFFFLFRHFSKNSSSTKQRPFTDKTCVNFESFSILALGLIAPPPMVDSVPRENVRKYKKI